MPGHDLQGTSHSLLSGPHNATLVYSRALTLDGWWAQGSPVYSDRLLFIQLYNGTLLALDASTGSQVWGADLETTSGSSVTLVGDDIVLTTDMMGGVYRFDARGALVYRTPASKCRIAVDLITSGGRVFLVDNCGFIIALNLSDGTPSWSRSFCGTGEGGPCVYRGLYHPIFAMADGSSLCPSDGCDTVFVAPDATAAPVSLLVALDASSGEPRWTRSWANPPELGAGIFSTLSIADGRIYWADGTRVFAVNAATGASVFNVTPTGVYSRMLGYPIIASRAGDVIFASLPAGGVFCLNASTGDTLWLTGLTVTPAAGALDSSGVLYIIDTVSVVHALSVATGAQLWEARTIDEGGVPVSNLAIGPGETLAVLTGSPSRVFIIGFNESPPFPPSSDSNGSPITRASLAGAVVACIISAAVIIIIVLWRWRRVGGRTAPECAREIATSTDDLFASLLALDPQKQLGGDGRNCSEGSWAPIPTTDSFVPASELWGESSNSGVGRAVAVETRDLDRLDGDSFVLQQPRDKFEL